ncbi:hypothetical protein RRG08_043647 [Elysia crispata]|uniref:Uncharacterized protein n=1 Tax=Elysia crispata TaxID=231223 RepID=A0AAE0ZWJ2_9GAST|nr:hypothetical protein RRG08_043647 [Elysia crispata]
MGSLSQWSKGLLSCFKPFSTVITQREQPLSFLKFKVALQNFEDTEKSDIHNTNLLLDGATTHIINDKAKFVNFGKSFRTTKHIIELTYGSRLNNTVRGRGEATVLWIPYSQKATSMPYAVPMAIQSSTVERAWRTLFEMFRCLLLQSGLPKTCTYAVMTAAYICNRWYNPRTKTTPFQSFTGRKSNIALPVMPTYKIPRNWMAEVRKVSVLVMIRKVQLI